MVSTRSSMSWVPSTHTSVTLRAAAGAFERERGARSGRAVDALLSPQREHYVRRHVEKRNGLDVVQRHCGRALRVGPARCSRCGVLYHVPAVRSALLPTSMDPICFSSPIALAPLMVAMRMTERADTAVALRDVSFPNRLADRISENMSSVLLL